MSLRAHCPNLDPDKPGHRLFVTTAHVMQEWVV